MSTKKEYEMKVHMQLQEWDTQINKLKTMTGYNDIAPQTIATSKDHELKELQERQATANKSTPAPQTIATSKEHVVKELRTQADHQRAPQTIATSAHHERIDALQSMHASATQKLETLKNTDDNDSSWEKLKSEIEDALKKLGNEIKSIASKVS